MRRAFGTDSSLLLGWHMITFFPLGSGAEREYFAVLSDQIV